MHFIRVIRANFQDEIQERPDLMVLIGDVKGVEEKLKQGMNPNTTNIHNQPLLLLATSYAEDHSKLDIVKLLLDYGADPNKPGKYGDTPLMWASSGITNNVLELIKLLIDFGADVNIKDDHGETALDYANRNQYYQSYKIVDLLKSKGAKSGSDL